MTTYYCPECEEIIDYTETNIEQDSKDLNKVIYFCSKCDTEVYDSVPAGLRASVSKVLREMYERAHKESGVQLTIDNEKSVIGNE